MKYHAVMTISTVNTIFTTNIVFESSMRSQFELYKYVHDVACKELEDVYPGLIVPGHPPVVLFYRLEPEEIS